MIVYLDTSALVPLVIDEPASFAWGEVWDGADKVVCTRLGYIEAAAAVAMAERLGRISAAQALDARSVLDELWLAVEVLELSDQLMRHAAELAMRHSLRGYDAAHCAAVLGLADPDLVAASGDQRLLAAWRSEGVAVYDATADLCQIDRR
ncbi:MAG: VapC toxin family PIN domain ribonuclease [Nocardioides sp.]|nr:VapC toxin family PIN domain ribonuclease [Nocardioides sp.]